MIIIICTTRYSSNSSRQIALYFTRDVCFVMVYIFSTSHLLLPLLITAHLFSSHLFSLFTRLPSPTLFSVPPLFYSVPFYSALFDFVLFSCCFSSFILFYPIIFFTYLFSTFLSYVILLSPHTTLSFHFPSQFFVFSFFYFRVRRTLGS